MKIRVIVNPSAAAGTAGKKIPELHRLLEQRSLQPEVIPTTHVGHATELARQAVNDAVDVIAVMGGDGTFSEVAQVFLGRDGVPTNGPALALIPAGTGGDLKRSLGLDNDVGAAVARIAAGTSVPFDLGVATFQTENGQSHRAFFNVASLGISGLVCHLTNQGSKLWGGRLTFYAASVRATLMYRNVPMSIRVDGELFHEGPVYLAGIANGRYFGGGMLLAPMASTNDALLDLVVLGDYSPWEAIGMSRAIYTGAHLRRSKTLTARGKVIEIRLPQTEAQRSELMELDGEVPHGSPPFIAQVYSGAIRLLR